MTSRHPRICVVIPCYKSKNKVLDVIKKIGDEVTKIILVDDKCPDLSGLHVEETCVDSRLKVIFNEENMGVGGATKRGYQAALKEDVDIVVKVDSDDQMDPSLIPTLIKPIVLGWADYAKGNRFYSYEDLKEMPKIRIFGNGILAFMTKVSSGYWTTFDPTNGFTAIHVEALKKLPLEKINNRFFFESDMLFRLNCIRAVVIDIPITSSYKDEVSNLSIGKSIAPFFFLNISNSGKRFIYNYLLRDFSLASIEFIFGTLFTLFAVLYGSFHWYISIHNNTTAPGGVIMLPALLFIVGVQFLLSAINYDICNIPKHPLSSLLGKSWSKNQEDEKIYESQKIENNNPLLRSENKNSVYSQ